MPSSSNFEQLLHRARIGDESAFLELASTYEKDLRIAARVHLGPALRPYLDSLDLVQSVHRSLMLGFRMAKFDIGSPEKLIALALTIVRRKVALQWRRHRRQTRLGDSIPEQFATLTGIDTDPAAIAAHRDLMSQVWRHLSHDERQLLELRLEGHSNAEVARIFGEPAETVRVRLHRLRKRLQASGLSADWLL